MVAYGNAFHDIPWFRFTWWSIKTSPPTRYPSNRLPLLHPNWDHSTIHSIGDLNTSESFTFTLRTYWLTHTAASHEKNNLVTWHYKTWGSNMRGNTTCFFYVFQGVHFPLLNITHQPTIRYNESIVVQPPQSDIKKKDRPFLILHTGCTSSPRKHVKIIGFGPKIHPHLDWTSHLVG